MAIRTEYDIIIIGSGPSGVSAAIRAAQLGASVIIVEKNKPGGTCLNWGCIPTKYLWEIVHKNKIYRRFQYFNPNNLSSLDFGLIQKNKQKTIDLLTKGLLQTIQSYSIPILWGTASFIDETNIKVITNDEKIYYLKAQNIIIATGSIPKSLNDIPFDHNKILTSDDALNLSELPSSILIVGGGAIGIELSTIFAGLGCKVTLIEKEKQILPDEDSESAQEIRKKMEQEGIEVITGINVSYEIIKNYEKTIIAIGRTPNIESLNINAAKIELSNKNIIINSFLETTNSHIYACGDVTGKYYLAYVAQQEGLQVSENILNNKNKKPINYNVIPRIVFSNPPYASVGIKEKDSYMGEMRLGKFYFSMNSKAFITGERTGWVKIFTEIDSDIIIGGNIFGPNADELITIISLAIQHKLKINELNRFLFFHPSYAEAIYGACQDVMGRSTDMPKKD